MTTWRRPRLDELPVDRADGMIREYTRRIVLRAMRADGQVLDIYGQIHDGILDALQKDTDESVLFSPIEMEGEVPVISIEGVYRYGFAKLGADRKDPAAQEHWFRVAIAAYWDAILEWMDEFRAEMERLGKIGALGLDNPDPRGRG